MIVMSICDGMSCGQIALNRLGVRVSKYYAAEIDKFAIKVAQSNYPNTIQIGDVLKWKEWAIDWSSIDLLIGGPPCQAFSFGGLKKAFKDPRSRPLSAFIEVRDHINLCRKLAGKKPVKFLMENVKMSAENKQIIDVIVGVNGVEVDSALLSAQSRKRVYWTNWGFKQPVEKDIWLADILLEGSTDRKKSLCITASYSKGKSNLRGYDEKSRRQIIFSGRPCTKGPYRTAMAAKSRKRVLIPAKPFYRQLEPVEVERLQTVPEGYTAVASRTQRFKMLGNGWTVDVICHILSAAFRGH